MLEGVVATKSPDSVDLKLSNTAPRRFHCTLATVAANYGKTVVDQHSLDKAARITPLEVDTRWPTLFWGPLRRWHQARKQRRGL